MTNPCTTWPIRRLVVRSCLFIGLLGLGCQHNEVGSVSLPPAEVTVATPVQQDVVEYERFTGRTSATEKVEIRARVSGYLIKAAFQPGAEVKKGDLLFEIDPRPYQADLERTEAEIKRTEARLERLGNDLKRAQRLRSTSAVSQEEFDKVAGDRAEAAAEVQAAKAKVSGEKLNVEYTKVLAPLDGKVGDRLVDVGNLVTGGQVSTTLLTTIVAVDPMDVSFDLDENTLQRLQQAVRDGHIKQNAGNIPVEMGLPIHNKAYPLKGTVNFVNNQVDPKTGTIRVKAEFPNPKPAVGDRILVPGLFVRLRVPIGDPRKALLVPESALGTDQGRKFLYVVNEKNVATRLDVTVGALQDGLRVIEEVQAPGDSKPRGLRPDEHVIVNGLQRVRPGLTVEPRPAGTR